MGDIVVVGTVLSTVRQFRKAGDAALGARASVAHQRFVFTGEKTCIDCHKGIAHHLPDMRDVPG
jgi:nitrate/TMAO reductase-like tetraheme cytochrome c subunit